MWSTNLARGMCTSGGICWDWLIQIKFTVIGGGQRKYNISLNFSLKSKQKLNLDWSPFLSFERKKSDKRRIKILMGTIPIICWLRVGVKSNWRLFWNNEVNMDGFIQTIDTATQSHDYGSLATIFTFGPSSWQALGQVIILKLQRPI